MLHRVPPAVTNNVFRSGSPKAQLVTSSTGIGTKSRSCPRGDRTYTPPLNLSAVSNGGLALLRPAATYSRPCGSILKPSGPRASRQSKISLRLAASIEPSDFSRNRQSFLAPPTLLL